MKVLSVPELSFSLISACMSNSNVPSLEAACQPVGEEVQEIPADSHVILVNTSCQDGCV